MKSLLKFVKDWMLPVAMVFGISSYLLFRYVPVLQPMEKHWITFASDIQPFLIFSMLFLQFVKVSPHDLGLRKWHIVLMLVQTLIFTGLGAIATLLPEGGAAKILVECFMLCLICPTATAAGVITDKLGGSLPAVMSYTVLINCVVSIVIPLMAPVVNPIDGFSFWQSFVQIISKVFSILILPCAVAWTIRYTTKRLQRWLMKYVGAAFYIWAVSLALALSLATQSLIDSKLSFWLTLGIAVVSFIGCISQFAIGRKVAKKLGRCESLSAGQAMGQKNTGFFIWIGFSFFNPVTSIAGGFYAIWHNIVNSYELYLMRKNNIPTRQYTDLD